MPITNNKISFKEVNHDLPSEGYLRLWQIVGGKGHPGIIPISKSSWWNGIKLKIYPQPIRFGKRMRLWRVDDIRQLIENSERHEQ